MRTRHIFAIAALTAITLTSCSNSADEQAPAPVESTASAADHHLHARGDGTISAVQGVTFELDGQTYTAGKKNVMTFKITRGGETITDFVEAHTKMMHVVVVRDDLSAYQHLHPEMSADGTWTMPITFPTGGSYRIVTDFKIAEGALDINYILGGDVVVDGKSAEPAALPAPTDRIEVDGFVVSVTGTLSAADHGMLMVTVTKDGVPVTFEDWLGTGGHLVAIREGDLAYAHMHPSGHDHDAASDEAATSTTDGATATSDVDTDMGMDHSDHMEMPGMLHFETEFPTGAGTYKFFLQFQVDGKVHTAEFVGVVG